MCTPSSVYFFLIGLVTGFLFANYLSLFSLYCSRRFHLLLLYSDDIVHVVFHIAFLCYCSSIPCSLFGVLLSDLGKTHGAFCSALLYVVHDILCVSVILLLCSSCDNLSCSSLGRSRHEQTDLSHELFTHTAHNESKST